ncbi:AraC family ligand binding domain-containing protein [Steroidobacter sp. S1-65]|uniref:AraC family ligand binding domain-containing protein n=1 Tax=Steroidobacter gossypii TaxID=2805490 RepID=A0ABS1WVM7_9GAMM|nr:AraC family ligand binding domain-containing protein [Steroidobacter gossypii]
MGIRERSRRSATHHPNEQITWVMKGSVEVFSQGKRFFVSAGQVIVFPRTFRTSFARWRTGPSTSIFSLRYDRTGSTGRRATSSRGLNDSAVISCGRRRNRYVY